MMGTSPRPMEAELTNRPTSDRSWQISDANHPLVNLYTLNFQNCWLPTVNGLPAALQF
jgi:hypothetical protein